MELESSFSQDDLEIRNQNLHPAMESDDTYEGNANGQKFHKSKMGSLSLKKTQLQIANRMEMRIHIFSCNHCLIKLFPQPDSQIEIYI